LPPLTNEALVASDYVPVYWKDTNEWGETFYDYGNEMWDGKDTPEFWLEEIPEVSEDQIICIIHDNIEWSNDDTTPIIHADKSAKAIHKLINGE